MKKFIASLILLLAAFSVNFAQTKKKTVRRVDPKPVETRIITAEAPAVAPRYSPEVEKRMQAFELVWTTLKDNYFDQTFNGLNWFKIRAEYEPQVRAATTDVQFHIILSEMIKRLNRSHFAIIPPDVYREIERVKTLSKRNQKKAEDGDGDGFGAVDGFDGTDVDPTEFARYGIGIELRLIDDKFVVTRVASGSPAENAGLKTGFVIDEIDDVSLKGLLEKFKNWSGASASMKRMLPIEIVEWYLNGLPETFVSIDYTDEKEQPKTVSIKRERLDGRIISVGRNFPAQFSTFETRSLNAEVGYIKFNIFSLQTIESFCAALTELKDKKALVIDLRGNIGGLFGSLVGVSSMLTDKSFDIGTQVYKVGSDRMIVAPKAKNFKGKLVFLTDNLSVSSAEILAASMQENKRAIIVGEKTAGEALPAVSLVLPTGAVLIYPIANFKTPNGKFLEGSGVVPNVTVSLDRKSLLEGKDNQLETALKIIKEDTQFPQQVEPKRLNVVIGGIGEGEDEPMLAKPTATPKPVPKVLGSVDVIPPKVKTEEVKDVKEEKALQVIDDFINTIGGSEALKKIESYQISGYAEVSLRGSIISTDISIFRQKPSKYSIIWKSESLGESRELYDGKGIVSQTEFGIDSNLPLPLDPAVIEVFAPINNLLNKDAFKSLKYSGIFDREGTKMHVIEGKTVKGESMGFAFDVQTKMLTGYSGPSIHFFLSDYRKVENVMLPFSIMRDVRMKILVMDIKLNPKIDESVFNKKENCFDRPN